MHHAFVAFCILRQTTKCSQPRCSNVSNILCQICALSGVLVYDSMGYLFHETRQRQKDDNGNKCLHCFVSS